jgi:two-component system chemotaxis response regulator CheY
MQRADILIIDDDEDIREMVACVLELHGYSAVTARNGSEALRLLRETSTCPRLILLDLRMPVMNGWQFLEHFAQLPTCSTIPVVVVTADRSVATHSLDRIAGFLFKPLNVSDILEAVGNYASGPPT